MKLFIPCPKCRNEFIGILPDNRFECMNCGIIWRMWSYACKMKYCPYCDDKFMKCPSHNIEIKEIEK